MYAVIETGGKQYRVEVGSELEIDRLDAEPGDTVELGRVLLVADGDSSEIGRPVVDGARVSASVVRQDRGEKIVVFKYRPKARRRVKQGHRQDLTVVRVADIEFGGRSAAREAEGRAQAKERAQAEAAAAAERQAAADRALADKLAREQTEAEATAAPAEKKATRRRTSPASAAAEGPTAADAPADDDGGATEAAGTDAGAETNTKPARATKTKKDE